MWHDLPSSLAQANVKEVLPKVEFRSENELTFRSTSFTSVITALVGNLIPLTHPILYPPPAVRALL